MTRNARIERTLTVDDVNVIPNGLALTDDAYALALERGADEARDLDGVDVGELLLEENALGGAEDRRRAAKYETGVS